MCKRTRVPDTLRSAGTVDPAHPRGKTYAPDRTDGDRKDRERDAAGLQRDALTSGRRFPDHLHHPPAFPEQGYAAEARVVVQVARPYRRCEAWGHSHGRAAPPGARTPGPPDNHSRDAPGALHGQGVTKTPLTGQVLRDRRDSRTGREQARAPSSQSHSSGSPSMRAISSVSGSPQPSETQGK